MKYATHKRTNIICFYIIVIEVTRTGKFIETESRIEFTKDRGEGRQKQGGKFKEMSFCLVN